MSLSRIATLLRRSTGMDVAALGASALKGAVRRRMAEMKVSGMDDYWARLEGSPDERRELIEEVVVPETWFFREPEAFAALAALPAPAGERRRLLSIPCSTGEEPYSMAICGLEAGWPSESFTIDAVDLSERSLARARRGVYGKNSFRSEQAPWRERYFQPRGAEWELQRSVRGQVRLRAGNIVEGSWAPAGATYHAIFCRNLLIYFDAEMQERALASLDGLLAPDGVLFVGAAEAFLTQRAGFQPAGTPASFTRRRPVPPRALSAPPAPPRRILVPKAAPKAPPARSPVPAAPSPRRPDLATARRHADAGRLEEARRDCEALLHEDAASAGALFLLGVVRDSQGDPKGAEECFRKVLYLEPGHGEALLQLAGLVEKAGDRAGARRLQGRARREQEAAGR